MKINMIRVVANAHVYLALAANYNYNLAERLVHYSGAAYCIGTSGVTNWNCNVCEKIPGFSHISQVLGSKHHGRALIGFDHVLKGRIVSFEGTTLDIHQIIDDVNIMPTHCYTDACPACRCHPGFFNAFDEIAEEIYSAVSKLPRGKLLITGHSLGAALTTHCALHLRKKGLAPDHIYTFGQPRVGNYHFAGFYDELKLDNWRVTHHRDPVTHLPWRGIGSYGHHLREAYYETASGGPPTRVCSYINAEDPKCTDQFNDEYTVAFAHDHYIINYVGLKTPISCGIHDSNFSVFV